MNTMKNKNIIKAGVMAMLFGMLAVSCNDDEMLEKRSLEQPCDYICFGVAPNNNMQKSGAAYGSDNGRTTNRFVLRSKNSKDTLCVRTIVSDGINLSRSDKPITRGNPVNNDNFYNKFKVFAYRYVGSGSSEYVENFFMNENATKNGDVYKTDHTYYWPGADYIFDFYAYAPADAPVSAPTDTKSKILSYTVPDNATEQKDIVVASRPQVGGDHNASVNLQFKHICTAVRFVVGSQMQPGQIKSVAIKGVKNSGSYDMDNGQWTLNNGVKDFTQELNQTTTGSETDGTDIITGEATFMMLPQTLPANAEIEVVFAPNGGAEKHLTAKIENTQWVMGKTVTYKLSIKPDYTLEFVSEPAMQDAHYVIYPIKIKADKLPSGGWTLTSNDPANVTFVESGKFKGGEDVQALVDAGYWLDGYNGTSTLTSTTTGNDIVVYVFLTENIANSDRNIELSLAPKTDPTATTTFNFKQYCPAWNGNLGVERIQDKDYPWGFNWDSQMKITYSMPGGWESGILHILFSIFGDKSFVTQSGWALAGTWKVIVDFSKVPAINTATSSTDGLANTWDIYNFDGVNESQTIMSQLESWGGTPDKTLPTNPAEFAARACAMKNKFSIETKTESGQTIYKPVLDKANMVWYLPAQNEATSMNDNLSGDYWTSTCITSPGTTAYKYTAGGSTSAEDRNSVIHVRAVRKK